MTAESFLLRAIGQGVATIAASWIVFQLVANQISPELPEAVAYSGGLLTWLMTSHWLVSLCFRRLRDAGRWPYGVVAPFVATSALIIAGFWAMPFFPRDPSSEDWEGILIWLSTSSAAIIVWGGTIITLCLAPSQRPRRPNNLQSG